MTSPEFNVSRSNIILYCRHWAETVSFYRDILKLDTASKKDWFVEFRLTENAFLSVADQKRSTVDSSNGKGLTVSLQIDDVRSARYRLEDLGIETSPVEWRWGAWAIFLYDPEGNRIELWS